MTTKLAPKGVRHLVPVWIAVGLCVLISIATLKKILTSRFPFVKPLEADTRDAYLFIVLAAALILAWTAIRSGYWQVTAIDVGGVKGELVKVQQAVATVQSDVKSLADQVEQLYGSQIQEVFDRGNWSRLRFKALKDHGYTVDVPLKRDPIPGSLAVTRGYLALPAPFLRVSGNHVSFRTYSNTFVEEDDTIVVVYQPRQEPPRTVPKK